MRDSCLHCVRKHLGQALVLLIEAAQSFEYEWHRWIAMGHLAEAEAEALESWPNLATTIRNARIGYFDDNERIDFKSIFDDIDDIIKSEDADDEKAAAETMSNPLLEIPPLVDGEQPH